VTGDIQYYGGAVGGGMTNSGVGGHCYPIGDFPDYWNPSPWFSPPVRYYPVYVPTYSPVLIPSTKELEDKIEKLTDEVGKLRHALRGKRGK
jgi:hypothetical protein